MRGCIKGCFVAVGAICVLAQTGGAQGLDDPFVVPGPLGVVEGSHVAVPTLAAPPPAVVQSPTVTLEPNNVLTVPSPPASPPLYAPSPGRYSSNLYALAGGGMARYAPTLSNATQTHSFDESYNLHLMGGLGYYFRDRLRFEARGQYVSRRESDSANGATGTLELSSISIMSNAVFEVAKTQGFAAYVGAGLGASFNSFDLAAQSANGSASARAAYYGTSIAYGGFAGLEFQVADNVSLFAEGAYSNFGSLALPDNVRADYDALSLTAGVRVGF